MRVSPFSLGPTRMTRSAQAIAGISWAIDYDATRSEGPLTQLPAGSTFTRASAAVGIDHLDRPFIGKSGEIVEWGKRRVENHVSWNMSSWQGSNLKTQLEDDWFEVAKTLNVSNESSASPSWSSVHKFVNASIELLAGSSSEVEFGIYCIALDWGISDDSSSVISGPGVLTRVLGSLFRVTGLSETVPTVISIRRSTGISVPSNTQLFIYPDKVSSTTIGASVIVRRPHLAATPEYTYPTESVSNGVLSAPYHGWGVDGVKYFNTDESGDPIPAATMRGIVCAPQQTNIVRSASDLTQNAWTKRGDTSATAAYDPVMGGLYTQVRDVGVAATDDIYTTTGSLSASVRYEPCFMLRPVSVSGTLKLSNAAVGDSAGRWDINLSLVNGPSLINRYHPAVTVVTEFSTTGAGNIGIWLSAVSGSLDFDISMITLVLGASTTTPIPNTSNSAAATRNGHTLSIPVSSNDEWTVLAGITATSQGLGGPRVFGSNGASDEAVLSRNNSEQLSAWDGGSSSTSAGHNLLINERTVVGATYSESEGRISLGSTAKVDSLNRSLDFAFTSLCLGSDYDGSNGNSAGLFGTLDMAKASPKVVSAEKLGSEIARYSR